MDTPIHGIVIDAGSNRNLRYGVVERWNRVAIGLNEQEHRDCVHRGPFCDVVAELENVPTWRPIKGAEKPDWSVDHGRASLVAVTNRINRTVTPISDVPGSFATSVATGATPDGQQGVCCPPDQIPRKPSAATMDPKNLSWTAASLICGCKSG